MRICLVAESYPPALGGAELVLERLVGGFLAQGHEVRVITSSWQRLTHGVEHEGALTVTRVRTLPFLKRFWFLLFSLPHVIRASRWADITQGSMFAGAPSAFLGAWIAGRKCVLLVFEVFGRRWFHFEPNRLRAVFYFLSERLIVRLPFDRRIAISAYTKDVLCSLGVPPSTIDVIYCGDSSLGMPSMSTKKVRDALGFGERDFLFLAYGRTGVTKGFEYFAEAIPGIAERVPHARFVLILSNYDSRIWRRVEKLCSAIPSPVCRLLPPLSQADLSAYVSAADCIVIPSLSEGFGFCAREAANAQKVIVAANAGSLPEVIEGKHVIVEPGSAQALVDGCVRAWKGEVLDGTHRVFDWERSASLYLHLYGKLLAT